LGIELNNDQVFAGYAGETWYKKQDKQVFEIAGSAGTGKTTIIMYLIERLGLDINQVLFLSFMGKAACRMAMEGLPAKTIHSAIYRYEKKILRDERGRIVYDENNRPKKVGQFVLKDKIGKGIKLIVLDEGGTVSEKLAEDLLSFGIPVIVLGDLNQLPPVFGKSYFLKEPDIILTKIMRQEEGNPIVYLAKRVLENRPLNIGVYGSSEVIPRSSLKEFHFTRSDVVLTETNRLRWNVNNYFRKNIKKYKQLDFPHVGEKVICRKNNWSRSIKKNFYLTNGMSGFVYDVFKSTFNGKTMVMDFRPDFTDGVFKNVKFNYNYMYALPSSVNYEDEASMPAYLRDIHTDRFEYAYAITVHLSQGSQYNRVLYLKEGIVGGADQQKLIYTAITRAIDGITIVV
jgi:exodeoxyribonuclease-5